MYFSSLQGHGTSCSSGASGAPTVCIQGTPRFSSLSISAKTGAPMRAMMRMFTTACGRVSKLYANLRHRPPNGPHRIRQHIHSATAHAAAEELLELLPHYERVLPIVGGSGVVLRKR